MIAAKDSFGDTHDETMRLIMVFGLALAVTGLPIFLHLIAQPLALVVCVATAVACARYLESDTPLIVLTPLIFQNLFVSIVSPFYNDQAEIDALKIYNFLTVTVIWLIVAARYFVHHGDQSKFVSRMILASTAVLGIVGIYFVAGLAVNPRNAIVYVRNIGQPILLFQLFLIVGSRHRLPLPTIITILLIAVTAAGYLELFALDFWYSLTNGYHALEVALAKRMTSTIEINAAREQGIVLSSPFDYQTTELLNMRIFSDLDLRFRRLQGPNLHPISFAYLLAMFISFESLHRHAILAALAAPLLIFANAKGPWILVILALAFCFFARLRHGDNLVMWGLLATLAAFIVFGFVNGMSHGDYHVLGFLGSFNGFIQKPIGHSLGEGGNLSMPDFSQINWVRYQHEGATDIAVESAVGVLLYQLGVAAFSLFILYGWIAAVCWRLYRLIGAPALALSASSVLIVLANGVFQEEALFAPLALSVVMIFVGATLGAADRIIAPIAKQQAL